MPTKFIALFIFTFTFLFQISCSTTQAPLPNSSIATEGAEFDWEEVLLTLKRGKLGFQNSSDLSINWLKQVFNQLYADPKNWSRAAYLIDRMKVVSDPKMRALRLFEEGRLYQLQNEWDLAESSWRQALETNPEFPEVKLALGNLLINGAQFSKAIPYLMESRQYPEARIALIAAQRQIGNTDIVDASCADVEDDAANARWESLYNCALFEEQNMLSPERAKALFQAALAKVSPQTESAQLVKQQLDRLSGPSPAPDAPADISNLAKAARSQAQTRKL